MTRITAVGGMLLALAALAACERSASRDGSARPPTDSQPAPAPPASPEVVYDARHGVIVLPDSARFRTTLFDLRVIGQLPVAGRQPYYVMSGRSCVDCDANLALYVHSPSDGPMRIGAEQPRYPYPGREVFYDDGSPQFEARAFFGDCAAAYPNAVVWYQRRRIEADQWRSSVLVVQAAGDGLRQVELDRILPEVTEAVAAVAAGRCREIRGIDRTSEP
ncbi:MAG TPA: hypothetical protein VD707_01095 [Gemmatimonadales bacterium]|jgi:hypothetical protein|nr:hypothetical protein [Gemmatimonadales bacterium]